MVYRTNGGHISRMTVDWSKSKREPKSAASNIENSGPNGARLNADSCCTGVLCDLMFIPAYSTLGTGDVHPANFQGCHC